MATEFLTEEDLSAGRLVAHHLIAEFEDTPSTDPKGARMSWDVNGNHAAMYARECPKCRGSHGVLWENAPSSVVVADDSPGAVYLHRLPEHFDTVVCQLCAYKGSFEEWGPHESLKRPDDRWHNSGDSVLALKRRKGTGREMVMDLHWYHAKPGVDKIVRWCIGDRIETHINEPAARQIARHIHARFVSQPIKHREKVRTRDFVATEALEAM